MEQSQPGSVHSPAVKELHRDANRDEGDQAEALPPGDKSDCRPGTDDKFKRVRRMLQGGEAGLGSALSPQDTRLAATAPIWLCANVETASAIVKPIVFGNLEQMKAELKKASEKKDMPIANPEGIVRFYAALLDMITSETAWVAVGLTPSAETCHATFTMRTVPGTRLAGTMGAVPNASAYKRALGNLHDNTVLNLAAAMDAETWEKSYHLFIDLMPKMMDTEVSQAELADLRKLVTNSFEAMGESLSFSFIPSGEGPGMFSMQYLFEVEDGEAMEEAIRDGLRLANSKIYQKLVGNFGMQAHADIESETTTYRGVRIHSARLTFELEDKEAPRCRCSQPCGVTDSTVAEASPTGTASTSSAQIPTRTLATWSTRSRPAVPRASARR